jgi:hypothetical protein
MPDSTIKTSPTTLIELIAAHKETVLLHNNLNDGEESDRVGDRLIELEDLVIDLEPKTLDELAFKSRFVFEAVECGTKDYHQGEITKDEGQLDQQKQGYLSIVENLERMAQRNLELRVEHYIEGDICDLKRLTTLVLEMLCNYSGDKEDLENAIMLAGFAQKAAVKVHSKYYKRAATC